MTITGWAAGLLALAFAAWLVRAIYVVAFRRGPWSFPPDPDTACRSVGVSCGALTGWVTSLLSIAVAAVVFLLWRYWRVQRRYRARAIRNARDLVPTAGPIFGKIVGREDLCRVVMEDLRDRKTGRPHVLVGGVGTGKTAVLVLLTEMLARRHAVPVPIRLRDADPLDFAELAEKRFTETINERLASAAEGEKIWRRLRQEGRIVVLADGLEEALSDARDDEERDSKIRIAIRKAYDQDLRLLIASRPHEPLRDMDATIHELEPLSEDAALTYVEEEGTTGDERRLGWVIGTANVADAPLYLQITKDIYGVDLLDQIVTRQAEVLGTLGHDPSRLRVRLLQTWERALVGGDLHPEVPLRPEERQVALEWLSALACAGLERDSMEVRLDSAVSAEAISTVKDRLDEIDRKADGKLRLATVDLRLAAAWGARLGLVEPLAGRVRFQHSLIQAYLGSRVMEAALRDRNYMETALRGSEHGLGGSRTQVSAAAAMTCIRDPAQSGPGREFLIALVLHSRAKLIEQEDAGYPPARSPALSPDSPAAVCQRLANAAAGRCDNKALDMYAAALEISASMRDHPCSAPQAAKTMSHIDLAKQVLAEWPKIHSADPQTMEEAKLGLVCRFGEAMRTLAGVHHECPDGLGYAQLYAICHAESSYRIRLAAAQEIGRGGTRAYRELAAVLATPLTGRKACPACSAARDKGQHPPGLASLPGMPATTRPSDDETHWAQHVSAWLAPLLIASVEADGDDHGQTSLYQHAKDNLKLWLRHLQPDEEHRDRLTISEEIALAQGFKYAANRRYGHVHALPAALGYLQEEALEMLRHAHYWFSQLTLIQALCLWQIQGSESLASRRHANPDAIVNHWLDVIGGQAASNGQVRRLHPFVEAAAVLCSRAIESCQPERYIWMDESDLVARVGSGRETTAAPKLRHDQWILASMGWSGLHPHAQQLVADVLILLNLAERGEQPHMIEQWLRRADKDIVPPCIRRDRRALKPDCTVGTAERNPPGSSCLDGCPFDLCPYPPKGQQRQRAELSEAFCRHQATLVHQTPLRRRTAGWQGMRARQMRTFWLDMAERARSGTTGN